MKRIGPFFSYFGAKWRLAPLYPEPQHARIVEPFAGAAGYSTLHYDRDVLLCDLDENVVSTWDYLIRATEDDLVALPDLEPGQRVAELELDRGPSCLIGWWLNQGGATPGQTMSKWGKGEKAKYYWGPHVRERIASQLHLIRHWTVTRADYRTIADMSATWFIDPPYQRAGTRYRHGAKSVDFAALADWCRSRSGQVLACENSGADWLPFEELTTVRLGKGGPRAANGYSREVLWLGAGR